jgi:hypothetical protein
LAKTFWILEHAETHAIHNYHQSITKDPSLILAVYSYNQTDRDNQNACAKTNFKGDIELYPCFFDIGADQYYKIKSIFWRVAVLVHEIHHLQIGLPSLHVDCLNGEAKGCDRKLETSPTTTSAYSYQVLYMNELLENNILNGLSIAAIRDLRDTVLKRRFNSR